MDKTVDVVSNDPGRPHFTLKMSGNIDVVAAFEPGWVNLGKLARGTSKSEVIGLTGRDVASVKLAAITTQASTTSRPVASSRATA